MLIVFGLPPAGLVCLRLQADKDRRLRFGRIIAMMFINLQRRKGDDLATSGAFGLQVFHF